MLTLDNGAEIRKLKLSPMTKADSENWWYGVVLAWNPATQEYVTWRVDFPGTAVGSCYSGNYFKPAHYSPDGYLDAGSDREAYSDAVKDFDRR